MDFFSSYENTVLTIIVLSFLVIMFSFIKAMRLKKYGIQTKASIILVNNIEYNDTIGSNGFDNSSSRYNALIEFKTEGNELKRVKIPISKKYLKKEYKNCLPIIYHKENVESPIINDILYIYQFPIGLILIFILLAIILSFK